VAAVPSLGRATGVEAPPRPSESAAASELYNRYATRIYRYCFARLRSREEAEDATQITFLNAFRGLSRGITPELEQAWLYKIAENVCLTRVRSNVRRLRVESPTDLEPMHDIVAAPVSAEIDLETLQDVLARLPEQQRRAILLREWQGLSYAEIAVELGISQSAVETLIFRARRSLAKGLREAESGGRLRKLANAGTIVGWLKSILLGGSAAVKVAAVVVAGAAVAAGTVSQARKEPSGQSKVQALAPIVALPMSRRMPVLHRPAAPSRATGRKAQPMHLAPVANSASPAAGVAAPSFRSGRRQRPEPAQEEPRAPRPDAPAAHAGTSPVVPAPADEQEKAPKPKDEKPAPADPPKPEHPVVPAPNEHAAPPATAHPQPPPVAGPKEKQKSDEPARPDDEDEQ
jgi:RNA polymerase sigma factor (sigma-70 family)